MEFRLRMNSAMTGIILTMMDVPLNASLNQDSFVLVEISQLLLNAQKYVEMERKWVIYLVTMAISLTVMDVLHNVKLKYFGIVMEEISQPLIHV